MSGHTKGPWVVDPKEDQGSPLIRTADGTPVLAFEYRDPDTEPMWVVESEDARLMAASPDLYDACKAALALLTDDGTQGGKRWTVKAIRAALTKAEAG